jgi:16S rRNA (guanine527-N7)-methyltransferase
MKSYGLENQEAPYTLTEQDNQVLQRFFLEEKLSSIEADQFKIYLRELIVWNKKFNITALHDAKQIVVNLFQDSLKIREYIDIAQAKGIVDVGSGGGFPGIPLKICFPDVPVILIEVNHKKKLFLEHIISLLGLKDIEVCSLDWRTFLRKTDYQADLFVTCAALPPEELIRMFKPSCNYNKAQLIYWASQLWQAGKKEKPFITKEIFYSLGHKKRRFVFFEQKTNKGEDSVE